MALCREESGWAELLMGAPGNELTGLGHTGQRGLKAPRGESEPWEESSSRQKP